MAPGLTIRDRLRVLQPNDPDSYFRICELVSGDMLGDLDDGADCGDVWQVQSYFEN